MLGYTTFYLFVYLREIEADAWTKIMIIFYIVIITWNIRHKKSSTEDENCDEHHFVTVDLKQYLGTEKKYQLISWILSAYHASCSTTG